MKIRVGNSNLLSMAALLGLAALTSQLTGCATANGVGGDGRATGDPGSQEQQRCLRGGRGWPGDFEHGRVPDLERQLRSSFLSESISQSGLFAKVADSNGHYKLTAFIGKVDQPHDGAFR